MSKDFTKKFIYREKNFQFEALIDYTSQRLWVIDYEFQNTDGFHKVLWEIARKNNLGKIIWPVRPGDKDYLQIDALNFEGYINGFFAGTPAYFLAGYPDPARSISPYLQEEKKALANILASPKGIKSKSLPGFKIRQASEKDIPEMVAIFLQVFITYPTPIYDPEYLSSAMKKGDIYIIAFQANQMVSVTAAEIDFKYCRAELTNCATLPEYRGLGLMGLLLKSLQELCRKKGVKCLYSLARSSSFGMNMVFHRLGYHFCGTLINNCHIGGRFEDMNIWASRPAFSKRKNAPHKPAGLLPGNFKP